MKRWEYVNDGNLLVSFKISGEDMGWVGPYTSKMFDAHPDEELTVLFRREPGGPVDTVRVGMVDELCYPSERVGGY